MTIKELVETVSEEDIIPYVVRLVSAGHMGGEIFRMNEYLDYFNKVLHTLKELTPIQLEEDWELMVIHGFTSDYPDNYEVYDYYDVSGFVNGQNDHAYSMICTPWEEILSMKIMDWCLKSQNPGDIMTNLIYEITYAGGADYSQWAEKIAKWHNRRDR